MLRLLVAASIWATIGAINVQWRENPAFSNKLAATTYVFSQLLKNRTLAEPNRTRTRLIVLPPLQ
jgi:hypothetical protein